MNIRKVDYLFFWLFRILVILWVISIGGCNLAPGFTNVPTTTQTWTFADGNSSIGINQSSLDNAANSRLMVFNNQLYAIWSENNPSNISQIRAAYYNGNISAPSWSPVDVNGPSGINVNPSENATTPALTVFGGELYATWSETNPSNVYQIRVAYYNGNTLAPSWRLVDGGGTNGLNYNSGFNANSPQLTVFNEELYATWSETNPSNVYQIRVAYYNGNASAPSWQPVDVNGTNVSGTNGINYNSGLNAVNPQLTVFNGELYATWSEFNANNISQIRVAVYNGRDSAPFWTFVDVNGTNGINYNSGFNAYSPQLAVFNGELYATWYEANANNISQIRVVVYNGKDSSPLWSFVDGNGTNGINQNSVNNATTPQLLGFNSTLYAMWSENNGTADQIRFSEYNGNPSAAVWQLADGGGPTGINFNSAFNATNPQMAIFGGDIYATWTELNGTTYQIRVAFTN